MNIIEEFKDKLNNIDFTALFQEIDQQRKGVVETIDLMRFC